MNGGTMPDSKVQLASASSSKQAKASRGEQNDHVKIIEQDRGGVSGASNKIRVPALDFNILQSNLDQEISLGEQEPLDEDQQELKDLVDATNGIGQIDQDYNAMKDHGDQNAPPIQMKQIGKHKVNMPIMNLSMINNKGSGAMEFDKAADKMGGTQGSTDATHPAGAANKAKGATMGSLGPAHSLGFSIDLTKLKANPDDGEAGANDYQLGVPNLKPQDFQDEFMAKYDEFSESWRMMLRK